MNTAKLLKLFTDWAQNLSSGLKIDPDQKLLSTEGRYSEGGYSSLLCWTKPAEPNKPLIQVFRLPEISKDPKMNLLVMTQNAWTIGIHLEFHEHAWHATNLFSVSTGPVDFQFEGKENPNDGIIYWVLNDLKRAGLTPAE